jgi:CheY-like chemotaxis protein
MEADGTALTHDGISALAIDDGFVRLEPTRTMRSHVSRVPAILCIDDEVLGLEIRKVVLEREGYVVHTAADGPTGIHIFRQQPIDAVVLDFAMPGMNGGAVAVALREIRPNIPILLLSAYLTLPDEVQSMVTLVANKGDGAVALLQNVKKILESGGDQRGDQR